MPQMAPTLWLSLLFLFSIALILFLIMNYFIFYPEKLDSASKLTLLPQNHWKW
uniref:ATP synthase complex subunit 8 n=1 Tax=Munidopsis verrilli TaxID=2652437 RepID=A0A5J6UPM2_9EUCA|nr:ATP synthase F0 subunit 8 [Munidopsis verrilli]